MYYVARLYFNFVKMKITESNTPCVSPFIERKDRLVPITRGRAVTRKATNGRCQVSRSTAKNGTLEGGGRTAPHTNEWWRRLGRPHVFSLDTFFYFGRSEVGLRFFRLFWVRPTGYCNPVCWPVVSADYSITAKTWLDTISGNFLACKYKFLNKFKSTCMHMQTNGVLYAYSACI
jgi:hypothetical protein